MNILNWRNERIEWNNKGILLVGQSIMLILLIKLM